MPVLLPCCRRRTGTKEPGESGWLAKGELANTEERAGATAASTQELEGNNARETPLASVVAIIHIVSLTTESCRLTAHDQLPFGTAVVRLLQTTTALIVYMAYRLSLIAYRHHRHHRPKQRRLDSPATLAGPG